MLWLTFFLSFPLLCLCDSFDLVCCNRCLREGVGTVNTSLSIFTGQCQDSIYCKPCLPGTFRNMINCRCDTCSRCAPDELMIRDCHTTGNTVCSGNSTDKSQKSAQLTSTCCEKCFLDASSGSGIVLAKERCSRSNFCNPCPSGSFRGVNDCQCYMCSTCPRGGNVTQGCTETANTVCSTDSVSFATPPKKLNIIGVFVLSVLLGFCSV